MDKEKETEGREKQHAESSVPECQGLLLRIHGSLQDS